jgi:hypothetical protein
MKKFFQKIGLFLTRMFGGLRKFAKFLNDHVDDAIAIGKKILEYMNNPAVVSVEGLLSYLLGDKYKYASEEVIQKVIDALLKAIDDMVGAKGCFDKPTAEQKILCFIDLLKQKTEHDRDGTLVKALSRFIVHKNGGEIKSNVADTMLQTRFFDLKHGITEV